MMRRTLAAIIVLGAVTVAVAQDSSGLQWRFKPGQAQKYLFKHKEVRTVEVGNLKAETTTIAEFDWLWTVQEVDSSGVALIDVKLNTLRFSTAGMNFDYSYDSARGNLGDSDYHKRIIGLMDQIRYAGKYQLRLDPTGRVVELKGMSKVLDENNPGMQILDYHGMNLRDESLSMFLQQALGRLPAKGDARWQIATEASLGDFGTAAGQASFEKDKTDADGLVPIRWSGTQAVDVNTRWITADVKGVLKTSKLSGAMRFDPRGGWLQSGTAMIGLSGDLKVGGGGFKLKYEHELELVKQP